MSTSFSQQASGKNAIFRSILAGAITAFALVLVLSSSDLFAQASESDSHQATVFTRSEMDSQFAKLAKQAKSTGAGGFVLGDYGSHKLLLSERTSSAGAEMHARFDDIIIVEKGHATLTTGGSILDSKTASDGETTGSGIQGGTKRLLGPGDMIHIPAGTPHQTTIAPGTTYSALVIKVKE